MLEEVIMQGSKQYKYPPKFEKAVTFLLQLYIDMKTDPIYKSGEYKQSTEFQERIKKELKIFNAFLINPDTNFMGMNQSDLAACILICNQLLPEHPQLFNLERAMHAKTPQIHGSRVILGGGLQGEKFEDVIRTIEKTFLDAPPAPQQKFEDLNYVKQAWNNFTYEALRKLQKYSPPFWGPGKKRKENIMGMLKQKNEPSYNDLLILIQNVEMELDRSEGMHGPSRVLRDELNPLIQKVKGPSSKKLNTSSKRVEKK